MHTVAELDAVSSATTFHFFETLEGHVERKRHLYLAGLSILFFLCTGFVAAKRQFCGDELFTFYVARLGGVREIYRALLSGADNHPPLDYLLRHASMAIVGANEFGERLPSLLGYWLLCACLYRFVSRRTNALGGLIAFLIPFSTAAYSYSYMGRSYAVQLGVCGLLLLAWQESHCGTGRHFGATLGFIIAITALLQLHYYAILIVLPLFGAELVRAFQRRRLDWRWIASTIMGVLSLSVLLPFIRYVSQYAHYFGTPVRFSSIVLAYKELLEPMPYLLVCCLLFTASIFATNRTTVDSGEKIFDLQLDEIVFGVMSLVMPVALAISAKLVTKAFYPKYALLMIPGFSILAAYLIFWGARDRRVRVAVFLTFLVGSLYAMGRNTWGYQDDDQVRYISQAEELARHTSELLIFNHPKFLVFDYYTHSSFNARARCVVSPELASRWTGRDTDDRSIRDLAPWGAGTVQQYTDLIRHERSFILVPPFGWVVPQLLQDGFRIEEIRISDHVITKRAYRP